MNQQINLYQPIFRRERHVFGAQTMLKVAGVMSCALIGIYLFGLFEVSGLEAEVKQLESREQAYAAQLQRIATGVSDENGMSLDQELSLLNGQLADRQRLVDVLQEQRFGKTVGFSSRLRALAESVVDGVWLTRIIADGKAEGLVLAGESIHEELIPTYLRGLSEAEDLDGMLFDDLQVSRKEDQPDRITFQVASRDTLGEVNDDLE